MLERLDNNLIIRAGKTVTDFLLPPRCPACAGRVLEHGALCGACWTGLDMIAAPYCCRCGLPFEVDAGANAMCGNCMKSPPEFDWARAAVCYEGLGRDLVLKLKHGNVGAGVPVLGSLMAAVVPTDSNIDIVVPVPLHRWRLLGRRFNQSQLLAASIGPRLGAPVDPFLLERHRATPSQGTLGRKQRDRNVRGAFRVAPKAAAALEGKTVLLVDDVLTTGATANACARALKRAGATEVGLLVFARVVRTRG